MGILDSLRFAQKAAEFTAATPTHEEAFNIDQVAVASLFGIGSAEPSLTPPARVSRAEAMQVPAVKRARDIICTTPATLPLVRLDKDFNVVPSSLLEQPEIDRPRVVTMAETLEDLLFEKEAWWRITVSDYSDFPVKVKKLCVSDVNCTGGKVYVNGQYVPDGQLIRFTSPNDPLLVAGARAIRTAIKLDKAAYNYADSPSPKEYFTSEVDIDTDEVKKLIAAWIASRQGGSTGWVPPSLTLNQMSTWSPKDLQLAEARDYVVMEIARLTGLDPQDLGVNANPNTYNSGVDRRRALIDFTLSGYAAAVYERLSMNDATPRGHIVRFDYQGFLKSDELERMQTYQAGIDMGLYPVEEVQRREELPPYTKPKEKAPAVAPVPPQPQEQPVQQSASMEGTVSFSSESETVALSFDLDDAEQFSVNTEKRTVTGMLLPFNVQTSDGRRMRFAPGSVSWQKAAVSRIKLDREHNLSNLLGSAVTVADKEKGVVASFKVAKTPAGDEALALAADGALDGLSAVVRVSNAVPDPNDENGVLVTAAQLVRATLTAQPAFDDARLTSVSMTAHEGNTTMDCPTCGTQHAAGTPCATPAPTVQLSAITDAIKEGFAALPQREVVPAGNAPSAAQVNEKPIYNFTAGQTGEYSFSKDLIAGLSRGDSEAAARVDKFMEEQFAVTTGNVATLNPSRQVPGMYVDQAEFEYPIWTAINKGGLTDNTPFIFPKRATGSGFVADHTEGVEPAGAAAFTTTSQTVTPTALSGKAIVNREVWDQGGNPMLDGLLWKEFERAYYEGLESFAVAQLNAIAGTITDINLGIAVVDAALEAAITSNLSALQYVRGGNRFRDFFVQVDLFKALAAAKDSNGRKLFPTINPQNATGTSQAFYEAISVGGLIAKPAWALAASGTVAASSWLFDRNVIHGWASPMRRFTMDAIKVATVELGIWGYKAFAVSDTSFVREVVYDPA